MKNTDPLSQEVPISYSSCIYSCFLFCFYFLISRVQGTKSLGNTGLHFILNCAMKTNHFFIIISRALS